MKIVLGLNDYCGSNLFGKRFIEASGFEFQVFAHQRYHNYLKNIDYLLDVVFGEQPVQYFKEFGVKCSKVNKQYTEMIINNLVEWQPDLVISDVEPFTIALAQLLSVPLWVCSPCLLYKGLQVEKPKIQINNIDLQYAIKKFVYSPLCNLFGRPKLKEGFEWVNPYYQVLEFPDHGNKYIEQTGSNKVFCTGETSILSDLINEDINFLMCPYPDDIEAKINAHYFEKFGVSIDIGYPKSLEYAISQTAKEPPRYIKDKSVWPLLHEKVEYEISNKKSSV